MALGPWYNNANAVLRLLPGTTQVRTRQSAPSVNLCGNLCLASPFDLSWHRLDLHRLFHRPHLFLLEGFAPQEQNKTIRTISRVCYFEHLETLTQSRIMLATPYARCPSSYARPRTASDCLTLTRATRHLLIPKQWRRLIPLLYFAWVSAKGKPDRARKAKATSA